MIAKISVVVTADGNLADIHRSLDSICGQNISALQVLCVNNGFDELSLERVKRYSQLYDFVTLIECGESTSKMEAFRAALAKAQGAYTLIAENGTFFETRAFMTFLNMAHESAADIFHFGIGNRASEGISVPYLNWLDRADWVHHGVLEAETLLQYAYIEKDFSVGLGDKFIKTDILKESLRKIAPTTPEKYGEALLMYEVLSRSKTYRGETSKIFVSRIVRTEKSAWLSLDEFEAIVSDYKWVDYIQNTDEQCANSRSMIEDICLSSLKYALGVWADSRVAYTDKLEALRLLIKYWGEDAVLCGLAKWYDHSKWEYAQFLQNVFDGQADASRRNVAVFIFSEEDISIASGLQAAVGFVGYSSGVQPQNTQFPLINIECDTTQGEYQDGLHVIYSAVHDYNIGTCIVPRCDFRDFWDILALRRCGVKVCVDARRVSDLSATARYYCTLRYWCNLLLLMQANAAILPDNADLTMLDQFGINRVDQTRDIGKILQTGKRQKPKSNCTATAIYEQALLREIYRQERDSLKKTEIRLKTVLGPLWKTMFRQVNIAYVRKGIKIGLLRQMFQNASLLGKMKLSAKVLMKIIGVNCTLGIESYIPTRKLPPKAKLLLTKEKILKAIAHPLKAGKKLIARIKSRKNKEKRLSMGNLNPDKVFYLVRITPGSEGILASYLYFLRQLKWLEKSDYIPVIDMQWAFYLNSHNSPKDKGKINAWEMYFKPVASYPLSVACKSQNVIRGKAGYRQQEDRYFSQYCLRENTEEAEKEFLEWCRLNQKYMHLTDKLSVQFENEFKSLVGSSRVIGVMIREGYAVLSNLNYELVGNHPRQPSITQVVSDLSAFLEKWDCDKIYVSAEYQQTVDAFKQAFGDKVIYTERFRKNFSDEKNAAEYQRKRDNYYKQISREQINIDYLKEVYFLSRCTCLAAGRSNAVLVAALWNNGKYEHRYIYDLGTYTVSNAKPVVTLEDKQ